VIVERVAHLRHSALFADTADRVLAGLAAALDEVRFAAGEQTSASSLVQIRDTSLLLIPVPPSATTRSSTRRVLTPST
jgi:hypothetical protein